MIRYRVNPILIPPLICSNLIKPIILDCTCKLVVSSQLLNDLFVYLKILIFKDIRIKELLELSQRSIFATTLLLVVVVKRVKLLVACVFKAHQVCVLAQFTLGGVDRRIVIL